MADREIDKLLARVPDGKRTIVKSPPPPPQRQVEPTPPPPPTRAQPQPERSISPPPGSIGAVKVGVEFGDTKVDFRTKSYGWVWGAILGLLGLGGGVAVTRQERPPAPNVDQTADPCPQNQPATSRSPLCLRLQQAENTVNSMAWDVEDLKKKLSREHILITDCQDNISEIRKALPRIEGIPRQK